MPDVLLLHIEAAYGNTSFAISKNGICTDVLFSAQSNQTADVAHTLVQQILDKNKLKFSDLNAVSVSSGPGSYTGLRIAAAMSKGICFAQNIPLIAIPTLQAMSYGCIHRYGQTGYDWYIPMIDARRMEVFTALYNHNLNYIIKPCASVLNEFSFENELKENTIFFSGNGSNKLKEVLKNPNAIFTDLLFQASTLIQLGLNQFNKNNFSDLAYSQPFYTKEFYTTASAISKIKGLDK